jgi:3-deoxy-D-manno-octulosonic-acid transferase
MDSLRAREWMRWQLPYIAYCYAYFPVTLTKRVLLKRKRAYLGLDPIVRRFWDKWGSAPATTGDPVWINMNSGGEVIMSAGLLRELKVDQAGFVLSTEAYDTFGLLTRQYGSNKVFFPPWDTELPVKRALARVKPRALVFVQNAYFPVLLRLARQQGVKTILVNALLSRNMERGNPTMDRATGLGFYRELDAISVQTDADAAAFHARGVDRARITVTGDLSTDLHGLQLTALERRRLRAELGLQDEPVFIVGSTHPGEREVIVETLLALRRRIPAMKFIVAPRQLHEAWCFTEECARRGFRTSTRTALNAGRATRDFDVLVLDTFGELRVLYGVADVAFIGSSIVPLNERGGGHNPLEPLVHGIVPLFGSQMNLWHHVVDVLRSAWPAIEVGGVEDLVARVEDVLGGRAPVSRIQEIGVSFIEESTGAMAQTVQFLRRELGLSDASENGGETINGRSATPLHA